MKRHIFLIIIFLFITECFSLEATIYEIKNVDTVFSNTLKKFISDRKIQYDDFNKKGFVTITISYINSDARNNDILESLTIRDQYYNINLEDNDLFPQAYFFLDDKLILIYSGNINKLFKPTYTKKSKRNFLKLLEPYLSKKTHLKVKDNDGNVIIDDKNFRDESYNIHTGIILQVKANKEYNVIRQNM